MMLVSNIVCYKAVFSVVTQRSSGLWGGALRDDTKNGCVADYLEQGFIITLHAKRNVSGSEHMMVVYGLGKWYAKHIQNW